MLGLGPYWISCFIFLQDKLNCMHTLQSSYDSCWTPMRRTYFEIHGHNATPYEGQSYFTVLKGHALSLEQWLQIEKCKALCSS